MTDFAPLDEDEDEDEDERQFALSCEHFSRIVELVEAFDLLDVDGRGCIESADIQRAAKALDGDLSPKLDLFWVEIHPYGKPGVSKVRFVRYFMRQMARQA